MPKPLDQSAFIDTYKAEADEYLIQLTQGLLSLEKNPGQPAVIEDMFRAAHTLKGVSRMMGFMEIQQVAHHLEDFFGMIREGSLVLNAQSTDEALAAIDWIGKTVETVVQGKPVTTDMRPICQTLKKYLEGNGAEAPPTAKEADALVESSPPVTPPLQPQRSPTATATHAAYKPKPIPQAAPKESKPAPRIGEYIRIPISRINTLFNLAGELVIHKVKSSYKLTNLRQLTQQVKTSHKRLAQLVEHGNGTAGESEFSQLLHQYSLDSERLRRQVTELAEMLSAEAVHLDPVIDELQYKVKELRMLPCATIFEGLERLVRDIANQEKKKVSLVIQGEDTELDKKLLEAMKPCLVHLLRNSVDHGIESPVDREASGKPQTGTIILRAFQQGGKAVIEVQDDGGGIDLDRVKQVALKKQIATEEELERMDEPELMNLLFAPGFSTSAIITDVSGRGVGLDVVRKEVEQLKGHCNVESQLGAGTTVSIELPLTVAIMEVLLVDANGQRFGLPLLAMEEIVRVKADQIQTIKNRMAIQLRDRTVPVVKLSDVLGLPTKPVDEDARRQQPTEWPMVIAGSAERRVGLLVDQVLSEEEVFIKSLGSHIGTLRNVGGAAILGTGEVIVILDVQDLIASARQTRASEQPKAAAVPGPKPKRRILIAEDSLTTREFERSLLEAQGYDVETAVDGLDALERVSRDEFDLVVSDVEMPRMNGFEFCRSLRQRPELQELPFVFVTTLDKDEEKRKGIEVGAQAYIVKGVFDQSNLLQTIERLIG